MVIALCPFGDASDAACFTSSVFSPFFLVCRVCICFQRVTSWAVRADRGRGSAARPAPAPLWLREGHRDACFTAAPTPAFCPSGALTILFKKKKKNL